MDRLPAPRRAVLVLGMHRSGTSVVTRALSEIGVDLGAHLMPPTKDNPLGYWENETIVGVNESILADLGSSWDGISPIDWSSVSLAKRQDFVYRAVRAICDEYGTKSLFGFKDPRVPRLLPIWQDACAQIGCFDHRYVIVVRNPLSVARSLQLRDGFEPEKSILLWLIHTMAALEYTVDRPRCLIEYDRFLNAPIEHTVRIASTVGCDPDERIVSGVQTYARAFVADNLRHSMFDIDALSAEPATAKIGVELFSALSDAAAEGSPLDGHEISRALRHAQEVVDSLKPLFRIAEVWDRRVQLLHVERARTLSESSRALADFDARSAELRLRNSELASLRSERDLLLAKLGGAQRESDVLRAHLEQVARQGAVAEQSNRKLNQEREAAIERAQRSERALTDAITESTRSQLVVASWKVQALATLERGSLREPVRLPLEPLRNVLPSRDAAASVWIRENDDASQLKIHGIEALAGTWIELAFVADWPSGAPPLQLRLDGEHDASQAFALTKSPAVERAVLVLFVPLGTRSGRICSVGDVRAFKFGEVVATPISRPAAWVRMWRRLRETGGIRQMLSDALRIDGYRFVRSIRTQVVIHYLKSFEGGRQA